MGLTLLELGRNLVNSLDDLNEFGGVKMKRFRLIAKAPGAAEERWVRCTRIAPAAVRLAAIRFALLWFAGTAVGLSADMPAAAMERRVGHAFSLDSGEPIYREIHTPRVAAGRLIGDRVHYVDPRGRTIARKTVNFAPDRVAPAFRLVDVRSGLVEGLEYPDADRMALFRREADGAERQRVEFEPPPGIVADAGFDLLIYQHFDDLAAGETLRFPFAVPSRLDTVDVRLRMIDRRRVLGEPAVVIRMEPDNLFLRWLAQPVDVAYHAETRALLRYEGLSNIDDPNGDGNYRVRIDFPPEGTAPQPP